MADKELTFWDHLDELRKVIFRILVAIVLFAILAFIGKKPLFDIILAPHRPDFILYRWLDQLARVLSMPSFLVDDFHVDLISTQLTSQFVIHMTTSIYTAILITSPYIIYQLFRFVSPALYDHEKKYSSKVIVSSFLLFFTGVLINYLIIFPLSFRFLSTYQVSEEVTNIITISSYMGTFIMLSLMMGIMFEIPILCWLFGKLGWITAPFMRRYRRHAVIIILTIAAIITPTTDIFTLLIVFIPFSYCMKSASTL